MTMSDDLRKPAVAGAFYPADIDSLLAEMEEYLSEADSSAPAGNILGAIVPHAGWYYSGHVAGAVLGAVDVPDRVIILGPNHGGVGALAALDDSKGWEFPFGTVSLDDELASAIAQKCARIETDATAHAEEHSIEVIVPFLYAKNRNVAITPISLYTQSKTAIDEISVAVAETAKKFGALIVASSDMSHYLPDAATRDIDGETIEIIKSLDYDLLMNMAGIEKRLCGTAAVAVAMATCRQNGARKAELIKYATSGDIEGKKDSVVGYAGFLISAL